MPLDPSAVGFTGPPLVFSYDWKDVVLYALGIGAKREELDYLYEGKGPRVYPTYAVCPAMRSLDECLSKLAGDLTMMVHGAQSTRFYRPIPPSGKMVVRSRVKDMYDLKRLAQAVIETEGSLESGERLFEANWSLLFRNGGGFNGPRPPKTVYVEAKEGAAPIFHIEEATSREQALLYRLSGDLNPLHADPEFAARVGFTQGPILHGLCTYGFVARAVVRGACGGDATRLLRLDTQFRKPVWPGETLIVEGFDAGDGKIALRAIARERDEAVLSGAWAEVAPAA
jgi:acyl dehydratase